MNKKLATIITVLAVAVLGGATFAFTGGEATPLQPVTTAEAAPTNDGQGTGDRPDDQQVVTAGAEAADIQGNENAAAAPASTTTPAVTQPAPTTIAPAAAPVHATGQPAAPAQPEQPAQPANTAEPTDPAEEDSEAIEAVTIQAGRFSQTYTAYAADFEGNPVAAQWYKYSELSIIWSNEGMKNLALNVEILSPTVGSSIDFRIGTPRGTQPGEYMATFMLVDPQNGQQLGYVNIPVFVTAPVAGDATDEVPTPIVTPAK